MQKGPIGAPLYEVKTFPIPPKQLYFGYKAPRTILTILRSQALQGCEYLTSSSWHRIFQYCKRTITELNTILGFCCLVSTIRAAWIVLTTFSKLKKCWKYLQFFPGVTSDIMHIHTPHYAGRLTTGNCLNAWLYRFMYVLHVTCNKKFEEEPVGGDRFHPKQRWA